MEREELLTNFGKDPEDQGLRPADLQPASPCLFSRGCTPAEAMCRFKDALNAPGIGGDAIEPGRLATIEHALRGFARAMGVTVGRVQRLTPEVVRTSHELRWLSKMHFEARHASMPVDREFMDRRLSPYEIISPAARTVSDAASRYAQGFTSRGRRDLAQWMTARCRELGWSEQEAAVGYLSAHRRDFMEPAVMAMHGRFDPQRDLGVLIWMVAESNAGLLPGLAALAAHGIRDRRWTIADRFGYCLEAYEAGADLLLWGPDTLWWMARPKVFGERVPQRLSRFRVHCADAPAVETELEKIFVWRGVVVPEKAVLAPETITAQEVSAEANAEVRRILLERMGPGKYLAEANATVLDVDLHEHNGTRALMLTHVRALDRNAVQFIEGRGESRPMTLLGEQCWLVCACPSTGRVYHMEVPPGTNTCAEADAYLMSMEGRRVRLIGAT